MARWSPDTRNRLSTAALELCRACEFDQITSKQIAESAGVTERTFYRHFTSKQDVFFAKHDIVAAALTTGLRHAPAGSTPRKVVASGFDNIYKQLQLSGRRGQLRERQRIIDNDRTLRDRRATELTQYAGLIHAEICLRGFDFPSATLVGVVGSQIIHSAYCAWLDNETSYWGDNFAAIWQDLARLVKL